jgi:DNA-binding GntR family transcriptional regulator
MFYVSRIISNKKDNDIRYFFCEDYVPADIGIELTKFNKDEFVQTYEAMGGASLCNITSISSGDFHSEKLRVEKGTPVVVLQQIVLDSNGKKIYLNKTYVNTENTDNSLVITRHSFV